MGLIQQFYGSVETADCIRTIVPYTVHFLPDSLLITPNCLPQKWLPARLSTGFAENLNEFAYFVSAPRILAHCISLKRLLYSESFYVITLKTSKQSKCSICSKYTIVFCLVIGSIPSITQYVFN